MHCHENDEPGVAMKFLLIALATTLVMPSLGQAKPTCVVETKKIIDEIGAITETGDDAEDAQAHATATCMERYQTEKNFSQDDAFDLCLNRIKCATKKL